LKLEKIKIETMKRRNNNIQNTRPSKKIKTTHSKNLTNEKSVVVKPKKPTHILELSNDSVATILSFLKRPQDLRLVCGKFDKSFRSRPTIIRNPRITYFSHRSSVPVPNWATKFENVAISLRNIPGMNTSHDEVENLPTMIASSIFKNVNMTLTGCVKFSAPATLQSLSFITPKKTHGRLTIKDASNLSSVGAFKNGLLILDSKSASNVESISARSPSSIWFNKKKAKKIKKLDYCDVVLRKGEKMCIQDNLVSFSSVNLLVEMNSHIGGDSLNNLVIQTLHLDTEKVDEEKYKLFTSQSLKTLSVQNTNLKLDERHDIRRLEKLRWGGEVDHTIIGKLNHLESLHLTDYEIRLSTIPFNSPLKKLTIVDPVISSATNTVLRRLHSLTELHLINVDWQSLTTIRFPPAVKKVTIVFKRMQLLPPTFLIEDYVDRWCSYCVVKPKVEITIP